MPKAHREGDTRTCGAATVVVGQDFVFVNKKLWAVEGDPDDHGGGALISRDNFGIYINRKRAIFKGDPANPDNLCSPRGGQQHCTPNALGTDENTSGANG